MADVDLEVELPLDCDVATCTILTYSDGRPSEIILAATSQDTVMHFRPGTRTTLAMRQFLECISLPDDEGEEMISRGPAR